MKESIKIRDSKIVGWGGISCPCCINLNSKKKCKVKISRRARRANKQEISGENRED